MNIEAMLLNLMITKIPNKNLAALLKVLVSSEFSSASTIAETVSNVNVGELLSAIGSKATPHLEQKTLGDLASLSWMEFLNTITLGDVVAIRGIPKDGYSAEELNRTLTPEIVLELMLNNKFNDIDESEVEIDEASIFGDEPDHLDVEPSYAGSKPILGW